VVACNHRLLRLGKCDPVIAINLEDAASGAVVASDLKRSLRDLERSLRTLGMVFASKHPTGRTTGKTTMSLYRRWYVEGGTYFFTVVIQGESTPKGSNTITRGKRFPVSSVVLNESGDHCFRRIIGFDLQWFNSD